MNWQLLAFSCAALISATLFPTALKALYWLLGSASVAVLVFVIGGAIVH